MNTQEAKFILASLRSVDRDTNDRQITEALELAKSDPDLKKWLDEQRALDRVISEKLSDIAPPSDLLPSILAGTRMEGTRVRKAHPIRFVTLMAALLAFLIAVTSLYQVHPGSTSDFQAAMIGEIEQLDSFKYRSSDQAEIRAWLKAHSGDSEFRVPRGMGDFDTAGCHILGWKGSRASLICFEAGAEDSKQVVHLVVVDSDLFPNLKEKELEVMTKGDWATVVWRENSRTYLLASKQKEADLRRLIESG